MKFDQDPSTVKKPLWNRKRVSFGIITNEKLPEVRLKRETFLSRLTTPLGYVVSTRHDESYAIVILAYENYC